MESVLKELEDYFQQSAELAHRCAQRAKRGCEEDNACCMNAEQQAYLHARDMVRAALKDLKARCQRGRRIVTTKKNRKPSLSAEARTARMPAKPETLVGALHDTVHREVGRGRAAKAVRIHNDDGKQKMIKKNRKPLFRVKAICAEFYVTLTCNRCGEDWDILDDSSYTKAAAKAKAVKAVRVCPFCLEKK